MGVAYSVGEVDHLYTFFSQWSPDFTTKCNKMNKKPRYLIREKNHNHYLFVEQDKAAMIDKLLRDSVNPAARNWIITVKKPKRCPSISSFEESDEPEYHEDLEDALPVLSDQSLLLDHLHLEKVAAHLPARTQGYPWHLVYSTAVHGSSLKTLYRNMTGLDSPVLLIIRDMHKKVFGAFSSDPFRISRICYGTGETFLFSFNPDFQLFKWTGENSYFISGNLESLQIGGGGGRFGLWLDGDLYRGSSFSCPTFHNAPLSTHEDFIVQELEFAGPG
ncbi:nuclear receptor coactivator 7 isoform X2 [Boleophthalmus pectinirostris]|uniref:nuclear receptor coactivator 7 isoform X2 n=1 Tax=Boleophthalmus pectinirostris TaxID=150288 RepID=UPI000A1C3718|nr:nuclear receptor coactivator 7 isoform X2 [Boleophthalmus pectinirostris]